MTPNAVTEKQIEFHTVKKEIKQTLQQLQTAQPTEDVRNAILVLERTIHELNGICDPTMALPFAPK